MIVVDGKISPLIMAVEEVVEAAEMGIEVREAPQEKCFNREDRAGVEVSNPLLLRPVASVIRMQYDGEMVSVSEQTATKIQVGECSWV